MKKRFLMMVLILSVVLSIASCSTPKTENSKNTDETSGATTEQPYTQLMSEEDFLFTELSDGTYSIKIKNHAITPTEVVIPSMYNGKPVTVIDDKAFDYCVGVKNITIPNSVTSIGRGAFYSCGMTSITIPNSVTSIDEGAFYKCMDLRSISLGNGVASIGDYAFEDCISLESICVSMENKTYHSTGNCLIETSSKTLVLGCKTSIIPNDGSVICIGDWAFTGCSTLESITIPDSVISIGFAAFRNCSSLIQKENGVSYVDKWVIGCDKDLKTVTLRGNTVGIANSAFTSCSKLESIMIPDSVKSIGKVSFDGCSSLTSITIPDAVTIIGDYAFCQCNSLASITIPNGVIRFGDFAFSDCRALTDVYYSGTEKDWECIDISNRGNDPIKSATIHYNSN